MRLRNVAYSEFEGSPQEWRLDGLSLGARNLIVGKNAAGKTRTLNIMHHLALALAGGVPLSPSSNYDVSFEDGGKDLRYRLRIHDSQVVEEVFSINNQVLLKRGIRGEGIIWAEKIDGGKNVEFQTPPTQLAAVARRDAIQHSFLDPLYAWGSSIRMYYFGTTLGKDRFSVFVEKGGVPFDERDQNAIVSLYRKAEKEFGDTFKQMVMRDMEGLDYPIEDIGLQPPISIRLVLAPPVGEMLGLYVKERGLPGITDQISMSQGMFRALSISIQLNYAELAHTAACILIDDIGEGLDFDRSCRLIDLVREKAGKSSAQLVLSTNDRFVMNRVPLEEWSVLQRDGTVVRVRNYDNSREIFEEFKLTGMSNFDFLATDFVNEQPQEGAITP